jgi:hypothetical protein
MLQRVFATFFFALGKYLLRSKPVVTAKEIKSGSISLEPPTIQEVVDLSFICDPATVIPKNGSIQYIFPSELSQTIP